MPEQGNPTELKSAVLFGLLYALVLFGVAATREHFQQSGLFVVAVLSGLPCPQSRLLAGKGAISRQKLGSLACPFNPENRFKAHTLTPFLLRNRRIRAVRDLAAEAE